MATHVSDGANGKTPSKGKIMFLPKGTPGNCWTIPRLPGATVELWKSWKNKGAIFSWQRRHGY